MHSRKRPYTKKHGDLHGPVLQSYISVSYTKEYGDIWKKNARLLVPCTETVYGFRFAPYTITKIYDRDTRPCITAKYGRIRQNTAVHGKIRNVYGRLRAFTDSVFVDPGIIKYIIVYILLKAMLLNWFDGFKGDILECSLTKYMYVRTKNTGYSRLLPFISHVSIYINFYMGLIIYFT